METFIKFKKRISEFENDNFSFNTSEICQNQSLRNKVNEDKSFKPFYGDTIVFDLSTNIKLQIEKIVDQLYLNCGSLFAERLKTNTFHMTLHDLNNNTDLSIISSDCFLSELKCFEIAKSTSINTDKINLKSNFIFNMVNTSLVLGLIPETEEDFNKLIMLYDKFESVIVLPYPFTPHITLGYFSYENHKEEDIKKLYELLKKLNKRTIHFSISTNDLFYQKFTNMNNYESLFKFTS
ncbi:MAG: hypothetical protein IIT58_12440 [Treponema sp.]|nr:hypothetical protein [Treponema sp.]